MSMMGVFREIPLPLLARLKVDPALAGEVARGDSPVSEEFQIPRPTAKDEKALKAMFSGSIDEIMARIPEEQRKMIESFPPEHQEKFKKEFIKQLTRFGIASQAAKSAPPKRERRSLAESELGKLLHIEKAWHGLHYLLAGTVDKSVEGAGEAVLGGEDTGPELGYGAARLLSPEKVASISAALSSLNRKTLRSRFKPKAMSKAEIYPGGWEDAEEEGDPANAEWLLDAFDNVRDFYKAVASRGAGMLLYLE